MKEKLLYTILAQAVGAAIGFVSCRNTTESSIYLGFSFLGFALLLRISRMDPGSLQRRSEGYARRVFFKSGGYVVIEENGCLVARIITIDKEKTVEPFCVVCGIFRPVHTVHCRDCNLCVAEMDHHCPWIGNCVGKGNYSEFMALLGIEMILGMAAVFLCSRDELLPIKITLSRAKTYVFLSICSFLTAIVSVLWGYFIFLSVKGTTARMFCLAYLKGKNNGQR